MTTTTTLGFGPRFLAGLACYLMLACAPAVSTSTATGGSSPGTGGSGTGGATGSGGGTGSGGTAAGSGGAGTGGAPAGTGGRGTGGAATGGATTGGTGGGAGGGRAAGGAGGGTAAGGSNGACSGVFCDGFEGSTMLGAAWTVDNAVAANVVEVVSTMAHTGTNSVHMRFATTAGATFIHETMGFPAPMNSLWGRVWLNVMTPMNTGHDVYIEASTGVNPTNTGVRALNTQGGNMAINVAPPDQGPTVAMPLPRGIWTCFEWHIAATGANGIVTLYMNGTMLATSPSYPIPALVYQRVGYEHYAADTTTGDMWIDDYAVGTARIPCN